MVSGAKEKALNRYKKLIEKIFLDRFKGSATQIEFERDDLTAAAREIGLKPPKNLGDVVYALRYRTSMPDSVSRTQPKGMEWIIEGIGRSKYAIKLVPINRIVPNSEFIAIKIPDATPEIVSAYALTDEQALLARVRYNRLVDIFLGVAAFSLQNHLRTTVASIGQVEVDEIYVAVDRQGRQFVLPVQAKGGSDQLSVVQTRQDMACCAEKYPNLICRPLSAQFMSGDVIAMFELIPDAAEVKIADEKHYRLVPADSIEAEDLAAYSLTTS